VAISLEYAYEERDFDSMKKSNNGLFDDHVETHRLRMKLRFFPGSLEQDLLPARRVLLNLSLKSL